VCAWESDFLSFHWRRGGGKGEREEEG
jgi:hypothetical protein